MDREPDLQDSGEGGVDMQGHFGNIDTASEPRKIADEVKSLPTAS